MDQIKELFERVKSLNFMYEKVLESSTLNFNIFSILRTESDEVNLHSRFLYELLNPEGSHNKKDLFLSLFLQEVKIDFLLENMKVKVMKEHQHIDILITNENQAIIIENKIYAEDRPKQLERYYKELENDFKDIKIIYLTLDGSEPSKDSKGDLSIETTNVTYKGHIIEWLTKCIDKASLFPTLRETIFQYQNLIKKLTGQSLIKEYIIESLYSKSIL